MKKNDRRSSLFWMAAAILICVGSFRLSVGNLTQPGPGFFSFMAGAVLALLSIILFLQSRKGGLEEKGKAFWLNPQGARQMVWMVFALLIYILAMNHAGFLLSTVLFLGFLFRGIGRQGWVTSVSMTVLSSSVAYLVFQYWLDVQLPRGFLGF